MARQNMSDLALLDEVDAFLKARNVFDPCPVEEVDRQVETLAKLGF